MADLELDSDIAVDAIVAALPSKNVTVAALTATGVTDLSSALPDLRFDESDQASGSRVTRMFSQGGLWFLAVAADNGSVTQEVMRVDRAGAATFNAASVTVPTPTASGQALAWGDDATVGALDATTGDFTGNVTLETAFAALQLDATTQGYIRFQGGDGITRAELTYNAGTGLFQLSRRDAAGTFQNAAFVYDVGTDAFAFQSASVTVPTPTASGQAVKVVAWDDTTGRYAVQGPNGVLEQGDTDWRDVTSLLNSPWTADYVLLRRIGQTVEWAFGNLNVNGAVSSTFMAAPTGYSSLRISTFTAANRASAVLYGDASTPGSGVETIVGTYGTNGDSMRAELATVSGYGTLTYTTTNTWPTSLPGTAV